MAGPRVKALNSPEKVQTARALHQDKRSSITEICRLLGVSQTIFSRYLKD